MKLDMRAPYVILDHLIKWHIIFLLILAVVSYLSTAIFEFYQLFLHDLGYVTPYHISNVHKNLQKFWPPKIMSDNFQPSLNQLNL
jgi:hypothetical protein